MLLWHAVDGLSYGYYCKYMTTISCVVQLQIAVYVFLIAPIAFAMLANIYIYGSTVQLLRDTTNDVSHLSNEESQAVRQLLFSTLMNMIFLVLAIIASGFIFQPQPSSNLLFPVTFAALLCCIGLFNLMFTICWTQEFHANKGLFNLSFIKENCCAASSGNYNIKDSFDNTDDGFSEKGSHKIENESKSISSPSPHPADHRDYQASTSDVQSHEQPLSPLSADGMRSRHSSPLMSSVCSSRQNNVQNYRPPEQKVPISADFSPTGPNLTVPKGSIKSDSLSSLENQSMTWDEEVMNDSYYVRQVDPNQFSSSSHRQERSLASSSQA